MKKLIFIIISALILISCNKGTEKNYLFIKNMIHSPDSISLFMKDTSYITKRAINSEFYSDSNTIKDITEHIKKYFQNGFHVKRDDIRKFTTEKIINQKPELIYLYNKHFILLISKINKEHKLSFFFIDEYHDNNWKLDEILIVDPFEQKEHDIWVPGK